MVEAPPAVVEEAVPALSATPSTDYRLTQLPDSKRLHSGLDGLLWDLCGRWGRRGKLVEEAMEIADRVLHEQDVIREQSDRQISEMLAGLAERFRCGASDREVVMCLACAAEISNRTLGLRPYGEQVMGAFALHRGLLAEMATGEGKTLTIGLAAVLAGMEGRPVHVITANDYLAERDAVALKPFYQACGLTVGFIRSDAPPETRRLHYTRSVVYGTSKEVVADFLRDRLMLADFQDGRRRALQRLLSRPMVASGALVQNGMYTAIVDEADHVLIDEAVTPLLISQQHPNELLVKAVMVANEAAGSFAIGRDFDTNPKFGEILLTAEGRRKVDDVSPESCLLFQNHRWKEELLIQAIRAREFFIRGRHYVISQDQVVIIDETTGRPAPQRSWRQGLHQAIEAKEGLPLSAPTENLASLSFQRFFRYYHKLSGVTGTGRENARELWHIYHLPVVVIPTHRPCLRRFDPECFTATADEKWDAVINAVFRVHGEGRPILIGCGSVNSSETLAERLTAAGFSFRLLNATQLKHEAEIVAEAGHWGMITVATNLAGRGTDIRLGPGVADLGGLHVIATERANAARIDRQLYGRCARQGDPGSVHAFASLDDELIKRFLPAFVANRFAALLRRHPAAGGIGCRYLFRFCQTAATGLDYRRRLGVLRRDKWLTQMLPLWGLDQSLREQ
jgi:preprotein translocase subunit SecA